ncbi:MAG: hypothetical protein Q7U88_09315 [Desulfocapsaceae bacterium]|nr:hypothetical protein [Desulfocapsaceae bacterium]
MTPQSRDPYYKLSDLVKSCAIQSRVHVRKKLVHVTKKAQDDAKGFGFVTETRIITFVSIGVFEEIKLDNTDVLDHDPDKGTPFDAYTFRIGPNKYVYLAFYQKPNGVWIIKSFHIPQFGDRTPPLTHSPFKLLEGLNK